MAVSFKNTISGDWTYARGMLRANFSTVESAQGNLYCVQLEFGYNNGIVSFLRFYASTADTYAGITTGASVDFTGDLTATTSNGAIFSQAFVPSDPQWIDSVTKDETNPRNLTIYANRVPWFNFTNATLYETLKQLYPDFGCFAMISGGGPAGASFVPNPYSAGLNSNYNYYSGSCVDLGSCTNAPGVSTDITTSNISPLGENYDGNPEELEGNWQDSLALGAYLLLTANPPSYKIQIDMYINGTASPSIGVEWTLMKDGAPVTDDPLLNNARLHIYAFAPFLTQGTSIFTAVDEETGLRTLSTYALLYGKQKSWDLQADSYDFIDSMYNTIASDCIRGMSEVLIIGNYGINKLPERLFWYFQAETYDEENGAQKTSLWQLVEPRVWETLYPDHELHEFSDGATPYNQVALEVVLHSGQSENMDGDDDNDGHGTDDTGDNDGNHGDEWPDFDPYNPTGFSGDNVLTKMYAMTAATLANVGNKLWSQSYFDVLKVQNNPIENIVSVKWFPFNPTGTTEEIKVGDVAFGINAQKINRMKVIDIGSYKYSGRTGLHNFLDQTPFTECQLHLPYIGTYQIDASYIFNNTLAVKYYVDLCTGECMAVVTIDGAPYLNATGMMGVDIPITSSDRVQTELKVMSSSLKTGAGIAGEVLSGDILGAAAGAATGALAICGADYTQQRTNNPSSACGSFQNHAVYLTIAYPDSFSTDGYGLRRADPGYAHTKGYPCHAWKRLMSFGDFETNERGEAVYKGKPYFVQIDKRTELNIAMTSEENAELESLLTTGIYI